MDVLNESIVLVMDVVIEAVPSFMAELVSEAAAVAKPRLPFPSVFSTWLIVPSAVGNFKPFNETVPEPADESSRSAFVVADIVLSCISTPSMVAELFAVKVVNVPATGVVAPMMVLSMLPPFMSALPINTLPVPAGASSRSEFVIRVLITLSLILMLESTVS